MEIASDFCGIQTHKSELRYARAPMMDAISSTMIFSCVKLTKTSEITLKSSEITLRDWKSQLSVEDNICHTQLPNVSWYSF